LAETGKEIIPNSRLHIGRNGIAVSEKKSSLRQREERRKKDEQKKRKGSWSLVSSKDRFSKNAHQISQKKRRERCSWALSGEILATRRGKPNFWSTMVEKWDYRVTSVLLDLNGKGG